MYLDYYTRNSALGKETKGKKTSGESTGPSVKHQRLRWASLSLPGS